MKGKVLERTLYLKEIDSTMVGLQIEHVSPFSVVSPSGSPLSIGSIDSLKKHVVPPSGRILFVIIAFARSLSKCRRAMSYIHMSYA